MNSKRITSIVPVDDDPLIQMYSEAFRCYRFRVPMALPHLRLCCGDILCGLICNPVKGNLVVCSTAQASQFVIGKFLARRGARILVESVNGLVMLVFVKSIIVVHQVIQVA